jgi:hypothetical protein
MNKTESKKLSVETILASDIDPKESEVFYIVRASQTTPDTSDSLYLMSTRWSSTSPPWPQPFLPTHLTSTALQLPAPFPPASPSSPLAPPPSASRTALHISPSPRLFALSHLSRLFGTPPSTSGPSAPPRHHLNHPHPGHPPTHRHRQQPLPMDANLPRMLHPLRQTLPPSLPLLPSNQPTPAPLPLRSQVCTLP